MPHDTSAVVLRFYEKQVKLPSDERTNMRSRRNTNRDRLKAGLESDEKPPTSAMHTQGSYAMRTMVQDAASDYDIDDGAYFQKTKLVGPKGGELSALAARQMVCDALQDDRFTKPPEVMKNCVRVFYNEGYHVDVPCYREFLVKDAWTGKEVTQYELASADWKRSDAREVTKWFDVENKRLSTDYQASDGQLCRVICLMKKFSRSRPSWKVSTATGFMLSKLATESFVSSRGRDDRSLRQTMQAIKARLDLSTDIQHPVLTGENMTREDDKRPIFFRDCLKDNLAHLKVLDGTPTHAEAMTAWDKFFSTKWFSEQPPPEEGDESGGSTSSGGPGPTKPVNKGGGGRYASPWRV